jgi:hypothetical protein
LKEGGRDEKIDYGNDDTFFPGCGAAARESGFYDHDTIYKNWDHLKFSIYGYKSPDSKAIEESRVEEWWGKTIGKYKQRNHYLW